MKIANPAKRKAGLNLTSLIDVLFILIIFFSVSSTFVEQPGINLTLPEADSGSDIQVDKVVVQIDKDERIYLNDQIIGRDSLVNAINLLFDKKTQDGITLKADSQVTHGTVISVMDILRKAGIYKITVSTTKPPL